MTYAYDPLNRLASVTDASGVTSYSYDPVGNLAGYSYPNGVSTSYVYDPLNRLTQMQSTCATGTGCGAPGTALASYGYTLGPAGNRLSVAELSGRTVTYGYDDLYRLTGETVAGDPHGKNGAVNYTFDNVGNRKQLNSTLPAIAATGLLNYDANDRTSTDPYDSNGNLLLSGAGANVYDFENRLVQAGGVKIVYDGDGNRVKETVATTTTSYLVADQNLTGYAQVMDEVQGGAVSRTYSYGLSLISQKLTAIGQGLSFYGFDGHGSVRFLTSSTGAITDTYDFDAFGNLISSTGTTPNSYLFAGEQFDPALGVYYNRARFYDQRQGRFWSTDSVEGDPESPPSLHKYLYASADPIDHVDPSGHEDIASITAAVSIATGLNNIEFVTGTAVMDQLQFGGNAGFKSLLKSFGFLVGGMVVLKIVGGTVRYLSAAAYNLNSKIALARFGKAAEYGILPLRLLKQIVPIGSGLEKHHLIEARFAPRLGIAADEIPGTALTRAEHQPFTNAWRTEIGYINGKNPVNTLTATVDNIWEAAQNVYADYPELLEYIRMFIKK